MARLVVFVTFLIGFMFTLSLYSKRDLPITNKPFNIKELEEQVAQKKKLEEMTHLAAESHGSAEEGQEKKDNLAAPIELSTPELQNGFAVYTQTGRCTTCHGKKGEGNKSQEAPKLAGQHSWYLASQLNKMKNKERLNPKMDIYIKKLTDKDFQDVALYLSKLPKQ